jgi:hypothetical protein
MRAVAVALLAASLIAEGVVFGAPRWAGGDQVLTDPGAFLLAAEAILGLILPWVLLRRGERLAGYVAVAILAVVAALAIGPLTTVLRAIADTF